MIHPTKDIKIWELRGDIINVIQELREQWAITDDPEARFAILETQVALRNASNRLYEATSEGIEIRRINQRRGATP